MPREGNSHAERVSLTKLTPAQWNPRTIKEPRFDNLCRSIEADSDFLRLRPILAQADGTIYAGNMRWHAAKHLGMSEVWAIVEDVPEQLAKERALRDNAAWGENVDDQLGELLAELKDAGSDIDLLGFESAELDRLLGVPVADPLSEWQGMPGFEQDDQLGDSEHRLIVHFKTLDARSAFAALIGQSLTEKTKYIWYPEEQFVDAQAKRWIDE